MAKPEDYSKLKLATVAKRIQAHLLKLEADEEWNASADASSITSRLYHPRAMRGQRSAIKIIWRSFQGGISYPREEAVAYLEWLDAGNKGTVYDYRQEAKT